MKRFFGIGVMGVVAALGACNSSSDAGDCTTLSQCCDQISDASSKSECQEVVSMNQVTSCQEAQADFEGASMCTVATSSLSSSTGCGALTSCCGGLSGDEQAACETVASSGNDSLCTAELATYQCPSTSSTSSGGCSGLSTCCDSLSGDDKESCQLVVSNNDATVCTEETAVLCPSSSGKGGSGSGSGTSTSTSGGSGCGDLSSCCSSMSTDEQPECEAIVSAAVSSTCSAALSSYQESGLCKGGDSSSGSGSSGSGCSGLSSCCSSLPSEEQAGCQAIVSEGSDSECSTELSAYEADDLCE